MEMDDRYTEIRNLARDGFYAEALRQLRTIEDRGEPDAELWYLLAAVLTAQEETAEAARYVRKCLQRDPEHAKALDLLKELPDTPEEEPAEFRNLSLGGSTQFEVELLKRPQWASRKCPHCGAKIARESLTCKYCHKTVRWFPWRLVFNYVTISIFLVIGIIAVMNWMSTSSSEPDLFYAPPLETGDWRIVPASEATVSITNVRFVKKGFLTFRRLDNSYSGTIEGDLNNHSDRWIGAINVAIWMKGYQFDIGFNYVKYFAIPPGESIHFKQVVPCKNRPQSYQMLVSDVQFIETTDPEAIAAVQEQRERQLAGLQQGSSFWSRLPWAGILWNVFLGMVALFLGARCVVLCSSTMKWTDEWKEDAIITVIATPPLVAVAILEFYLVAGLVLLAREGIVLGPIHIIAISGPSIFYFIIVGYFFKRGCWGTAGIALFAGMIKAFLMGLFDAIFGLFG